MVYTTSVLWKMIMWNSTSEKHHRYWNILHPMNIKKLVKIQLMRTFHHIQFEHNSKWLFFMQGMFSVHSLYFMDKLLLLIPAVSINSYYLLVSLIIVLRKGLVAACLYFALLLDTSPSVFTSWRHKRWSGYCQLWCRKH